MNQDNCLMYKYNLYMYMLEQSYIHVYTCNCVYSLVIAVANVHRYMYIHLTTKFAVCLHMSIVCICTPVTTLYTKKRRS